VHRGTTLPLLYSIVTRDDRLGILKGKRPRAYFDCILGKECNCVADNAKGRELY
jgi:hypothetical protein